MGKHKVWGHCEDCGTLTYRRRRSDRPFICLCCVEKRMTRAIRIQKGLAILKSKP